MDPLTGKHPSKTPYHYCSNDPINRVDPTGMEDVPNGGGTTEPSGDPPKASDGTGASDYQGRDVIDVNGVSYETWKEGDTVWAQKSSNVGKPHTSAPINNIANEAARDKARDHWENEPKQIQTEPTLVPSSDSISKEEAVIQEPSEASSSTTTQSAPNSAASGSNSNSQTSKQSTESSSDSTNTDLLDNLKTGSDTAGTIADGSRDAMKKGKSDTMKEGKKKTESANKFKVEKGKVPTRLQKAINVIEDTLKKFDKWIDRFDNTGQFFDVTSFILGAIKTLRNPTPENIFELVYDSIVTIGTTLLKIGAWAISILADMFKQTDMYKNFQNSIFKLFNVKPS